LSTFFFRPLLHYSLLLFLPYTFLYHLFIFFHSLFCSKSLKIVVAITVWLCLETLPLVAQVEPRIVRYDTIRMDTSRLVRFSNKVLFFRKDTLIVLPDTLRYDVVSKNSYIGTQSFYDSLEKRMEKRKLTGWLYDIIFSRTYEGFNTDQLQNQASEKPFRRFKGKIIRYIVIKKLDPFGTNIQDTLFYKPSRLEKLANRLHVLTKDRLIRQSLVFKPGDPLDPVRLADAERVLRRLPFFQDARIYVRQINSEEVDVVVVTKDLLTIGGQVGANGLDNYTFNVSENNFLGAGQRLGGDLFITPNSSLAWGYGLHHRVENLRGTFIQTQADYVRNFDNETLNFQAIRSFYTPFVKYAGSVQVFQTSRTDFLTPLDEDTLALPFTNTYRLLDVWFGRSLALKSRFSDGEDDNTLRRNIIFSGRIQNKTFLSRPFVSTDSNRFFQNYSLGLVSVAYSQRSYYKSGLIFGFGRTEDIPVGKVVEITAGVNPGEFFNRSYFGISLRQGWLVNKAGYIQPEIGVGGYYRKGQLEQGLIRAKINTFSPLMRLGSYKSRHFLQATYVNGINRLSIESININDQNGIRGLSSAYLRGSEKLVFNLDNFVFTPWYLYGFRFVIDPFVDIGWVSNGDKLFRQANFYSGFGLGIKLRNENLVFQTFVLRLAYYPVVPANAPPYSFNIADENRIDFRDFDSRSPSVLDYQ
jgi:hypothetical protein